MECKYIELYQHTVHNYIIQTEKSILEGEIALFRDSKNKQLSAS